MTDPAHPAAAPAAAPAAPTSTTSPASATSSSPALPAWACVLLGVGAAVAGLLPWLAGGIRLPLQNLWATETMPDDLPLVLLPFSQYALTSIVGLIVTGSAIGGLLARALRPRLPRRGFAGLFVGVLAVQVVAVAQTAFTVQLGLQHRVESTIYLAGLTALAVFSIAVGALVLWLVARAPRAGALIGLAFGSIAVGFWATTALQSVLTFGGPGVWWVSTVLHLLPAALIGAAIAWCGVATVGRVVAAIASLVVLWLAPPFATAVSSAIGTRVMAGYPAEMLDYGAQVFVMAATLPEVVLPPVVVAIVVAGLGLALVAVRRSSTAGAAAGTGTGTGTEASVD